MHVGIVGEGPATDAVRAAVSEDASRVSAVDSGTVGRVDLAVVAGTVGAEGFDAANEAALSSASPWIAVELGGVGGHAVDGLAAAVSGFGPEQGCFRCLRTRVGASGDGTDVQETVADGAGAGTGAPDGPDRRFAGAVAGREAARLLRGDASPVLGGVVEVPYRQREFLPIPGCVCDTGIEDGLDRRHRPRDLDTMLAAAERALDPRVGVVSEVGEAESWPAPYYLATLSDTAGFSDATASPAAAGVAPGWDAAFAKALGEGLERYAAGVYRMDEFDRARPGDLPSPVQPGAFVAPESFAESDGEGPLPWTAGEHLATGERVQLPAEFVVFPPPSVRHRPAITTGLGLGSGGVEALLAGLYEVVERDAAMLAWYSTFEQLGLAVEDEAFGTLSRRARSEDLDVTALLLTQDVDVPVVAACVHREGDWPRFAAGMDADLDPGAAAASALAEALQNWMELRGMDREDAAEEAGSVARYAEFPPAARDFVDPATTVPAPSVGPADLVDGEAELASLVARVEDAGLDPYASRVTTRDVEALGFEVVRVLVPSAQPLFAGDHFFGERAKAVPESLGFEPRLDREHHPFP